MAPSTFPVLSLERERIAFFPLSWTIVHPIGADSPLAGLTAEDLAETDAEFLILLTGIDDTFAQTVHGRHFYTYDSIRFHHHYVDMIEVADDGVGIPEDQRRRIFEPYYSTKPHGTGLGLAIVSRIVSDHHGYIRVQENEPRGARFVLELPATRAEAERGAAAVGPSLGSAR